MRSDRLRTEDGFTLVELLITSALMGLLAIGSAELMLRSSYRLTEMRRSTDFQQNLHALSGHLQRSMGTGTLRFYGYNTAPAGLSPSRRLSRFLIPAPEKCRDLVSTHRLCAKATELTYVHYSREVSPALPVFCVIQQGASALGPIRKVLIDLNDTAYGTITYARSRFVPAPRGVSFMSAAFDLTDLASGRKETFSLERNSVVSVLDPPAGLLWRLDRAGAVHETVRTESSGDLKFGGGELLPDACRQRLKLSGAGTPLTDQIYSLRVAPVSMAPFVTGAANQKVSEETVDASWGRFPARLIRPVLRSLGSQPTNLGTARAYVSSGATPPQDPNEDVLDFGYSSCSFDSFGRLTCQAASGFPILPVYRSLLEERFTVPLRDASGNAVSADRFELSRPDGTASSLCAAGTCQSLPTSADGTSKTESVSQEKLDQPRADSMSFLKQEVLRSIKVRLQTHPTQESKEAAFEIQY